MTISGRSLSPPCRVDLESAPGIGTDSTLYGGESARLHIGGGAAIRHGGHFEARCVRIWPIWGASMTLPTATGPHFALLRAPGDASVHRARRALSAEVGLAARCATGQKDHEWQQVLSWMQQCMQMRSYDSNVWKTFETAWKIAVK